MFHYVEDRNALLTLSSAEQFLSNGAIFTKRQTRCLRLENTQYFQMAVATRMFLYAMFDMLDERQTHLSRQKITDYARENKQKYFEMMLFKIMNTPVWYETFSGGEQEIRDKMDSLVLGNTTFTVASKWTYELFVDYKARASSSGNHWLKHTLSTKGQQLRDYYEQGYVF